eukprot:CAMPEP_0176362890 /NCGR_PEP_ID=MMETSP0126-20121128/18737_1 /TAXON_ID=141414 ORGANISM="Strombidinopsis acuminatum, Strain SPMC142" /NCGR_SAMPLE_ID=MMETSP0126 /ASSEMBLY_ACC=CAM_ASM_000229 /LENGTH=90 /DNA_ID=CAMNT_0017718973 /DNA_START=456 /DNA_END=725 /DNA_ORIENTATION=+
MAQKAKGLPAIKENDKDSEEEFEESEEAEEDEEDEDDVTSLVESSPSFKELDNQRTRKSNQAQQPNRNRGGNSGYNENPNKYKQGKYDIN